MTTHWSTSCLSGVVWGAGLAPMLCPLERIKTCQQLSPETVSVVTVVKKIVHEEGFQGFYKGFRPYLTGRVVKQVWRWPMMTHLPRSLESVKRSWLKQLITGFSIATVDALLTLTFDRKKIQAMAAVKTHLRWYSGLPTYWTKLAVPWGGMLISQDYFRRLFGKRKVAIGFATATVVTLTMAPFDLAHTYKQSHNISFFQALRHGPFRALFPLFSIRFIENTALASLLDYLS